MTVNVTWNIGVVLTKPATMAAPAVAVESPTSIRVTRGAAPNDGGSAILRYDFRWSSDAGSTWDRINNVGEEEIIEVPADSTHLVQQRAVNAVDFGDWSTSTVVVTGPVLTVPEAPPAPVVTANGETELNVFWPGDSTFDDGGSALTDREYQISSDGTTWSAEASFDATLIHDITGLSAEDTRYARVRGVNAQGDGEWSLAGSGTTDAASPNPPTFITTGPNSQSWPVGTVVSLDLSAFVQGDATITYALNSGTLPAGLSLSSAGVISGTVTTVTASSSITVGCSNSAGTLDITFNVAVVAAITTAPIMFNFSGWNEWQPDMVFRNLLKQDTWRQSPADNTFPDENKDSNGYPDTVPAGQNGCLILLELNDELHSAIYDNYILYIKYKVDQRLTITFEGSASEQGTRVYDSVNFIEKIYVDMNSRNNGTFRIRFALPASNTGSFEIEEMALVRAGDGGITDETDLTAWLGGDYFRPEYITFLSEMKPDILRFLNQTEANGNIDVISNWPTAAESNWEDQLPFEPMMKLCNLVGAEPWITFPVNCQSTVFQEYGAAAKAYLNSGKKARCAFGNEIWNNGFLQTHLAYGLSVVWAHDLGSTETARYTGVSLTSGSKNITMASEADAIALYDAWALNDSQRITFGGREYNIRSRTGSTIEINLTPREDTGTYDLTLGPSFSLFDDWYAFKTKEMRLAVKAGYGTGADDVIYSVLEDNIGGRALRHTAPTWQALDPLNWEHPLQANDGHAVALYYANNMTEELATVEERRPSSDGVTLTCVAGSTTVTIAGDDTTGWAVNDRLTLNKKLYKITSIDSATTVTIETAFPSNYVEDVLHRWRHPILDKFEGGDVAGAIADLHTAMHDDGTTYKKSIPQRREAAKSIWNESKNVANGTADLLMYEGRSHFLEPDQTGVSLRFLPLWIAYSENETYQDTDADRWLKSAQTFFDGPICSYQFMTSQSANGDWGIFLNETDTRAYATSLKNKILATPRWYGPDAPPTATFVPDDLALEQGKSMVPVDFSENFSRVTTSFSLNPAVSGLTISSSGVLSGAPTSAVTGQSLEIIGTNSNGSDSHTITLDVTGVTLPGTLGEFTVASGTSNKLEKVGSDNMLGAGDIDEQEVSFRVKFKTPNNFKTLSQMNTGSPLVNLQGGGWRVRFRNASNSTFLDESIASGSLNDDVWHTLYFSYNGATGVWQAKTDTGSVSTGTTTASSCLFNKSDSRWFAGLDGEFERFSLWVGTGASVDLTSSSVITAMDDHTVAGSVGGTAAFDLYGAAGDVNSIANYASGAGITVEGTIT